ncbi:MAG TPA: winged helix DNA-binding domain-containing protein, partial [Actinomycetota bacterium]
IHGFRRDALTEALRRRRAIQATLMRETIHIVAARDFWPYVVAVRRARREWRMRVIRELAGVDMTQVAKLVRRFLENGPRRAKEIEELVADHGYPRVAWGSVGDWVDLVRVPPSGTWEHRRADLYGLAERWLAPSKVTEDDAQQHLIRSYLGGFGPASLKDIASWSGLPARTVRPVIERMQLRRFRDQDGGELLDLERRPLPDPGTTAPVRFIPTWDATLLVHARRTQILPERYRPFVFDTKTPHSVPTFLVDGRVAGSWRYQAGRVNLEPFEPIPRPFRRDLDDEASRLAAFHAD